MATAGDTRHIFLIGFMASGKSAVGRLLAEAMDRPFVDLDDVIEARAGDTVASIFASEGEAGFRRRETEALTQVMGGPRAVVATGGGTPCYDDNLARMRASGLVVALTAPLAVIRERVQAAGAAARVRPLLDRPDAEINALFARRVPVYRQAHVGLRTEDTTPQALARRIRALAVAAAAVPEAALAQTSLVALTETAYPVIVAAGGFERLGEHVRQALGRQCQRLAVVSDSNVAALYGEPARTALEAAGFVADVHVVPAGEGAKCFAEFARLTEALVAAGLDRRSSILALGGGVVGDLAGFAAACLFRGIDCVQVPTTVLAMVDSAIGGKTGINIEAGKNLVGAFWQPRAVLADPQLLATLPVRERRAAFGEIIKYALLDGEELYATVDALAPVMARDDGDTTGEVAAVTEVIRRCAAIKSWIVSRDEREQTGERALLNLGHTIGHAIEAAAGYEQILHGEAVALGLIAACRISARLGHCAPELEQRVAETVRRAGLAADLDRWLQPEVVPGARGRAVEFIGVDKKRAGKRIGFVTVSAVGSCRQTEIAVADLLGMLPP